MSELPPGWVRTTLSAVCTIRAGYGFPEHLQGKPFGDLPFYKVGDISSAWKKGAAFLSDADSWLTLAEAETLRMNPLRAGTTVFAKIGAAVGLNRRAMLSVDSLVDNNVMGLSASQELLDPRFLFFFACTLRLMEMAQATTVPSVRKSSVEQIPFPLPPKNEQDRIVAELEKQFSRLDAAMVALKRVQANLKRYRASVLKAACEGQLSNHPSPKLYPRIKVKSLLSEPLANGRSPQTSAEGSRILRLTALKDGGVDIGQWRRGVVAAGNLKSLAIRSDDILISRGNGSVSLVGVAGLVEIDTDTEPILYPDTMIRARLNPELCDPHFFVLIWNSRFLRDQIERTARTTAGIHKIAQSDIERFEIPLPSVEEQREIVATAERALVMAERSAASMERLTSHTHRLRASVLTTAFSGKLVPQNPSDEPASVLLERIRAEPSASAQPNPRKPIRRTRRGRVYA